MNALVINIWKLWKSLLWNRQWNVKMALYPALNSNQVAFKIIFVSTRTSTRQLLFLTFIRYAMLKAFFGRGLIVTQGGGRTCSVGKAHLGTSSSLHSLGGEFESVHYTPSFYITSRSLYLPLERQRYLILKCCEILVFWDHQRWEEHHLFSSLHVFPRRVLAIWRSYLVASKALLRQALQNSCWRRSILSNIDESSYLQSEKHDKFPFPCKCEKHFLFCRLLFGFFCSRKSQARRECS